MKVTAIIPAYNEEALIKQTVMSVKKIPGVEDVIVVDDGSRDRTGFRAEEAGARVIRLPSNAGKGNALNEGAKYASGEIVVLIDADLGKTAMEAEKLIQPVAEGRADMTIARISASRGSGGFGLGKGLARFGVRLLTGKEINSVLSGQRAMRYEVLQELLPFAPGFGVEVGMTVKALKLGCRIEEVPVNMKHKETGKDLRGFVHRGKQFGHILKFFVTLLIGGERCCRWS